MTAHHNLYHAANVLLSYSDALSDARLIRLEAAFQRRNLPVPVDLTTALMGRGLQPCLQ